MKAESRLSEYYHFDEDVLQRVGATALQQNHVSFRELAEAHGIGHGPERAKPLASGNRIIEYYLINPTKEYDETQLRICQAPMGIPADKSMAMRAMRLFGSDPTIPLMVVGSPASLGNNSHRLKLRDLTEVSQGNLKPAVRPTLQFIMDRSVTKIEVVGYSYGADAGAAILAAASDFGLEADRAVLMEPAGIKKQSVAQLAKRFASSGAELEGYVDQTNSQPLFDARNRNQSAVAGTLGFVKWAGGFLKASNLAISHGLGQGAFSPTLDEALQKQKQLNVTLAWGSASELVDLSAITESVHHLNVRHPNRIIPMEMTGMHHGGGDDIDLHAAMVLQGLALTQNR